jgi:hypothetical protein
MTVPNFEIMSDAMRKLYECNGRLHGAYDARSSVFRRDVDEKLGQVVWYKGRVKSGHGSDKDADCYCAWVNRCPLTVMAEARELRRLSEPGQPIFGYSYSFTVGGHMSGSAKTLGAAIQEAALRAFDADPRDSDNRLSKAAFFEEMQCDLTSAGTYTDDFMTAEFLTPIEVAETDGPRP